MIRMEVGKKEFDAHNGPKNVIKMDGLDHYVIDTHHGVVISKYENNGYDDSDYYAIVWNSEQNNFHHIRYATTRAWTYLNDATIDATPEVLKAYQEKLEENRIKLEERENAERAKMPVAGKTIRVVKGRKIPIGTIAKVFWLGEDKFNRPAKKNPYQFSLDMFIYFARQYRVGIILDSGEKFFINAENVEIV